MKNSKIYLIFIFNFINFFTMDNSFGKKKLIDLYNKLFLISDKNDFLCINEIKITKIGVEKNTLKNNFKLLEISSGNLDELKEKFLKNFDNFKNKEKNDFKRLVDYIECFYNYSNLVSSKFFFIEEENGKIDFKKNLEKLFDNLLKIINEEKCSDKHFTNACRVCANRNLNQLNRSIYYNSTDISNNIIENDFTKHLTEILKSKALTFRHEIGHALIDNQKNGFIVINKDGLEKKNNYITTGLNIYLNNQICNCNSIVPDEKENPLSAYSLQFFTNDKKMTDEIYFTLFIFNKICKNLQINNCDDYSFCLKGDFERAFNYFNAEEIDININKDKIKELKINLNEYGIFEEYLKPFLIDFSKNYLNKNSNDENENINEAMSFLLKIKRRFIDTIDLNQLNEKNTLVENIIYDKENLFNDLNNRSYCFISELRNLNKNSNILKKEEELFNKFLKEGNFIKSDYFKIKINNLNCENQQQQQNEEDITQENNKSLIDCNIF